MSIFAFFLTFRSWELRKVLLSLRSQKRVLQGRLKSSKKKHWDKGELRPIFKSVFLTSFQLLDSDNYKKRYFGAFRGVENWKSETFWRSRPAGGLLEAQRATCGSLLGPLGSHGSLESFIEHKPVILVVRSRSKRWNIGGCALKWGVHRRHIPKKVGEGWRFPRHLGFSKSLQGAETSVAVSWNE